MLTLQVTSLITERLALSAITNYSYYKSSSLNRYHQRFSFMEHTLRLKALAFKRRPFYRMR